jgi:hypothetical protein
MDEIIYFELNNWFCGEHYPNEDPFLSWMINDCKIKFRDTEWVKENKLCVVASFVDMSQNFCVTATKEWVENNCPNILNYPKFIRIADADGSVEGRFGNSFLEYKEENFGISWDENDDE